jgi:hypothetical protein
VCGTRVAGSAGGEPSRPPWLRTLDADHFFADATDDPETACRNAIGWAMTGKGGG